MKKEKKRLSKNQLDPQEVLRWIEELAQPEPNRTHAAGWVAQVATATIDPPKEGELDSEIEWWEISTPAYEELHPEEDDDSLSGLDDAFRPWETHPPTT